MISPQFFYKTLLSHDISFYAGVPDSLLKSFCAYITSHAPDGHHVITANEGGAIALAVGYHLATGKTSLVYMQNSGLGNTINPLASLTDKEVYSIPVLLLIGWRGEPGIHDEPQHVKQGKVTIGLLEAMGIRYDVLSKEEERAELQIKTACDYMARTNECYALVVERGTFADCQLPDSHPQAALPLTREEAIRTVTKVLSEKDVIVSTTGMISRELFEYRTVQSQGHNRDFLTVGAMGHASQIALGIAMQKRDRRVWCFDGDGAVLMHMGGMAIIGQSKVGNYVHVVLNNGAHDSVGGQPTVGLGIDLPRIARAVGYPHTYSVSSEKDLKDVLREIVARPGLAFLEIKVRKGNRKDLGRPTTTPVENKVALMTFLED